MISFVLFLEASRPSMNFNISELVYSYIVTSKDHSSRKVLVLERYREL